jgi:Recombination endonuclease VII
MENVVGCLGAFLLGRPKKSAQHHKEYHKAYHKAWYQENKEKRTAQIAEYKSENQEKVKDFERWAAIKYKYDLTKEAWETLFDGQGQRCAMCGSDDPRSKYGWKTDHCHETGKVRGILCHQCNVMLGNAEDDPQRLLAGVAYLEAHQDYVIRQPE